MVYKTKFLKQVVEEDYDPAADGTYTWELSDQALAAIWLTIKGDIVKENQCIDDFCDSITKIDLWFGGFNVIHYEHSIKALLMNCKLKQHWPYLVNSTQTIDDVTGVTFPILLGAPYLNQAMALPASLNNRKRLSLTVDIATIALDDLYLDISEVILPDASPAGCIKQEEISVAAKGTGDHDVWMQTNWDLLKLMLYSPHVPDGAVYTTTSHLDTNGYPGSIYTQKSWTSLKAQGRLKTTLTSQPEAQPLECRLTLKTGCVTMANLTFSTSRT
jgi:hypothetical protein